MKIQTLAFCLSSQLFVTAQAMARPPVGASPSSAAPASSVAPASSAAPADEGSNEINLAVGENKTISAVDVKNYSEGVAGVADVKLTTDRLQFVVAGQKPGSTTLLLLKRDGSQEQWVINVLSRPTDVVYREVAQLLSGTTGVKLVRVGGRIFIEGGVDTDGELKRIQQISQLYPGQVLSLVAVGAPAADRKIDIRIDFFFVQYDKTKGYQVGIAWPGKIGGTGIVGSNFGYDFVAHSTTAQATVVNQPLPSLDIAANRGWAKVLKQSSVISANGNQATFESGGEQNFPITSGLVAGIKSINFGTNLTVLPRFDPRTRDLTIQVTADVSDLVAPAGSTVLPGRNTTHLVTSVDLKLGQSLVLSGIRTRSQRHSVSGLPLLSDIPVLGLLFGTHGDAMEDVEGAIFVVPSVIETVPSASLELITSAVKQYEDYSGDVRAVRTFEHTPPVLKSSEE
jgi:pilus assembly protein CpaC